MFLPLKIIFLAIFASQVCQPEGLRQGYFSQYGKSPTDGTIAYHQNESGRLPQDMSQYVGVIAVKDCSLVGDDAWIRIIDERANPEYAGFWLPVKIFDCSGHTETTEWMNENNILGELGYYLAQALDLNGEGQIPGEIILTAPASVERICEPTEEIPTPIPVYEPHGTLTVPQILTEEAEVPTTTPTPTYTTIPPAVIVWHAVANTTRTAMMSATPTPTPGLTMVDVPLVNTQVKNVTAFDTIENLPLVLACLAFGLWIGFGSLMFLAGLFFRSVRDNRSQAEMASVLSDLRDTLQKQYPDLPDDDK